MSSNTQTIHTDKRGRMRLRVTRKVGKFGPQYSAIVFRSYKKAEDAGGKPEFADTHWLDEQDVLPAKKLLDIADDVIAEAKRQDAQQHGQEAA